MASDKRARELARAKHERQQQRRQEEKQTGRKRALIAAGVTGAVIVVVFGFLALRSSPDDSANTADPSASPSAPLSPSADASAPPAPVPTPENVSCTEATPTNQTKTFTKPGNEKLKAGAAITFATNCGDIEFTLETEAAPKTANAIAYLASQGFYNGLGCPRLTVERLYVLQCGSPTNDQTGGPGFTLPDENLPTDKDPNYPTGTVAMANSGPGTGGSQMFLVYKDTQIASNYTIFGRITKGLDVVQYVAAKGVAPGSANLSDGPPAQPLVISSATVRNG